MLTKCQHYASIMLAFQVPAFLLMSLNASGMPAFFDIGVGIMPAFRKPQMPAECQHYASISENASIPASIFGKYHDGVPQLPAKRRVGIFAEQVKHFPVSATMQ